MTFAKEVDHRCKKLCNKVRIANMATARNLRLCPTKFNLDKTRNQITCSKEMGDDDNDDDDVDDDIFIIVIEKVKVWLKLEST
jgi:hypothetical protein